MFCKQGVIGCEGTSKMFVCPTTFECRKFKPIKLHQVGFECSQYLWVSSRLKLYSYKRKLPFVCPYHLPKFGGKKPETTTKVTIRTTNNHIITSHNNIHYQIAKTWLPIISSNAIMSTMHCVLRGTSIRNATG